MTEHVIPKPMSEADKAKLIADYIASGKVRKIAASETGITEKVRYTNTPITTYTPRFSSRPNIHSTRSE